VNIDIDFRYDSEEEEKTGCTNTYNSEREVRLNESDALSTPLLKVYLYHTTIIIL
jgi:hypothetical protein